MKKAAMLLLGVAVGLAACSGDTSGPTGLTSVMAVVPESGVIVQDNSLLPDPETCEPEWHWVINGLGSEADAPAFITVHFASAGDIQVPLEKFTGGVAHYTTDQYLTDALSGDGATAVMAPGTEYNRFNLSHGPCPAFQACSPGFWGATNGRTGNIIHLSSWPDGITTATLFTAYFNLPAGKPAGWTLYNALQQPGTTLNNAAFIGTGALLSALSAGVNYQYSVAEIVAAVNAALAGNALSVSPSLFDLAATFGPDHDCPLP